MSYLPYPYYVVSSHYQRHYNKLATNNDAELLRRVNNQETYWLRSFTTPCVSTKILPVIYYPLTCPNIKYSGKLYANSTAKDKVDIKPLTETKNMTKW